MKAEKKSKNSEISEDTEVDITLYKTVNKKSVQKIWEAVSKKGWKMKVGMKNYLKQGNGF